MNASIDPSSSLAEIAGAQAAHAVSGGRTYLTEALIGQLIAQQHDLTAVESFSLWHEEEYPRAAAYQPYQALLPVTTPAPGQQYAFEVNLDTCSGCKACVVACHTLNGLGDTETWRKVGILTSKSAKLPVLQHVTTACHHCVDPGCLKGCPVLAYEKDHVTGIVRHLDDQCFGCKYCTMMCPYEVPQYNESLGIVRKCDMCSQRLEHGEAPACVQACPNQAIKISLVERSDVARNAHAADTCLVPTAPPSRQTLPTTRYVSTMLSQRPTPSQLISRESHEDVVQHGHAALVGMLVLTQASVGTWLVLASLWFLGLSSARTMQAVLWLGTAIGLIGVHLALLHLGRPWLAFRSFLGWRTSWLSREAIAFGAYLTCACAGALASAYASPIFAAASVATCAAGAVAVVCSAMIYVATGRELWSLGRTLGEFAATTIGLGTAIASLAMPSEQQPLLLVLAALICGAGFIPKWLDWRRSEALQPVGNAWSIRSGRLLHEALAYRWRVACCSLATSLCVALLATLYGLSADGQSSSQEVAWLCGLGWSASASLLLLSQATVRWLGFASVVFPRMPGAGT